MNPYRPQILGLYKKFLYYARFLETPSKKYEAIGEIQATFRRNARKNHLNAEQISSLLEKGESRLSFLKMQVPRARHQSEAKVQHYHIENGQIKEGEGVARMKRAFNDKRLDIEDYQRHVRLLERQHFQGRDTPLRSELTPLK